MGCVSSKILEKSGSLREKLNQSFQKRNVFEEVLTSNSRSSGDQFLALLRSQNSAAKSIKATTPFSDKPEPDLDEKANNSIENSPPLEPPKIETINTWELLAGLDEDNCEEEQEQEQEQETMHSKDCNADAAGRARSFRTVEDYDAMVAGSDLPEEAKEIDSSSNEQIVEKKEEKEIHEASSGKQSNELQAKVSKRKAMAKELGALKVTTFEFNKSGSLREWLLQGGQVFSPGSYVTPKFGDFVASETKIGEVGDDDHHTIFDPELVAQFEQAMKQLTAEEEFILREIEEVSEGELLHEPIKVDFQGAISV